MFLTNTSRYPINDVRALVKLAAEGYDTRDVAVKIKNSEHAFRGRAYSRAPREYSRNLHKAVRRLVTVCIGPPKKFIRDTPLTNHYTTVKWQRITDERAARIKEAGRHDYVRACGTSEAQYYEERVTQTTPYGGLKSPVIEYHTWQEAMVAVTAHELHHIDQFQNKRPVSERYCEQAALKALERYRAALAAGTFLIKPVKAKPTKTQIMDKKFTHTQKMLKLALTREKRATTLRKKWQQRVKYYEKKSNVVEMPMPVELKQLRSEQAAVSGRS